LRAHKTGHIIADTVSDLMGDLPDGDYRIAYGILRHRLFNGSHDKWFEVDKGMYGAKHYDGNYRISYKSTQPNYSVDAPHEPHGQSLEPWRKTKGYTLICPPTAHVCEFFGVDYTTWLMNTVRQEENYIIRNKGETSPIDWDGMGKLVTFNSSLGVESIKKGIPTVSSIHSSVGSYQSYKNVVDDYDRNELLSFISAHQFLLSDKDKICSLINYYLQKP